MGTNITGIGNANAIGFKSRVTGGAYFPPELKDALVGVWSAYGKSNDSTDRNIIKNKIKDRGGDFVISNAAFKLNSGFGKYDVDFTSWIQTNGVIASSDKVQNSITGRFLYFNTVNKKEDIPSFKVNITLGQQSKLQYNYIKEDGTSTYIVYSGSGIYTIPASYFSKYTGGNAWFGFYQIEGTSIIEQIPSFEGAFVTDGIDDLITSTKTVQEMLGGSNEITVVSMMANLDSRQILCNSNFSNVNGYNVRNTLEPNGVITMLGYTDKNGTTNNLNLIMGDKDSIKLVDKVNFNSDYVFYPAQYYKAYYQVAWYWTFIANRVLTEDEINLVIEKYNLDRPGEIVKPQVYYNIKKQKISNDNHSAFDDKLIDYSGNGYDAKLYNFGWKEDSGIGKYETDFTDWKKSFKVTSFDSESIKFTSDVSWVLLYHPSSIGEDIPSFKVRIKLYGKGTLYYNYITQEGKYTNVAVKSEIFETPICYNTKYTGEKGVNVGFTLGVISGECSGTITQIPEYENALVLDGVDDYGKVTGLPILKDYTVVTDREILANIGAISSKNNPGAFLETAGSSVYSFGQATSGLKLIFTRSISYLSKYSYCGQSITAGAAEDGTDMWLGTIRDNDSRFFNGAIYFLMLFPYSMSEFLIERQIEKIKGGTLYPNQVEFRPVIPEDENITRIDYFVVDSGVWKVIKPGDYVDVGARIVLNVYTKLPYKIEKVSSPAFTGMSVRHSTELNIFDVEGYIKDKTPQKIKLTLAINEDIVQWNPTITSNLLDSFTASSWYLNGWDNTLTEGTWIKKTDRVFFKATFKTELYGLETATFGGAECVVSKADNWSDSTNIWDIRMLGTVGDLSQIFNLDVYELIRFEDIVQPYPVLLRFKDENGNEVSWGGKFRVGSTITRIGSAADSNLLPNIYNIFGLLLNDNQVTSSKVIVEKTMVFKAKSAYIFDNNEPKCILSPSRLRIPNSSYKLLGYIPDISGHGNHGKINNSAYAEGSGVNEDGSYQFDGVDDFVTIPTIVGGKQVLMKVNWRSDVGAVTLYDQRLNISDYEFAIYNGTRDLDDNPVMAYQGRNNGQTYIDGILNNNIMASELKAITHNITITNELSLGTNKTYPIIGSSKSNAYFVNMALYDFMLFDKISTEDKIKELNEYVGIEAKVELPPYYWDAYGKTNLDADKATIQQRGVAVGDYDLTNYNHAYEGMSGYNGYPVVFGANKTWEQMPTGTFTWNIDDNKLHITKALIAGNGLLFSYVKLNGSLLNVKEIPSFKIKVSGLEGKSKLWYRYLKTEDAISETTVVLENGTHELPKSYIPSDSLHDGVWIGFTVSPISEGVKEFDCDITIEVLPEYENGLVYDAITDYSKNANIPALDDFTAIIKREWLKKQGCPLIKGSKVYEGGNGNALLLEWDKAYNFVFYKRTDIMEGELPDNISFITPTNYNGNVITRGSEQDTNGICIAGDGNAGFANMVFYKLILYPKTIPLLQINFLKNLMERDEIIDLNNPIFIKNE